MVPPVLHLQRAAFAPAAGDASAAYGPLAGRGRGGHARCLARRDAGQSRRSRCRTSFYMPLDRAESSTGTGSVCFHPEVPFLWVSADERERMGVPKFYRWLSCAAPLAARHSPFPAHPSPPLRLLLRTSQRALPSDHPARLRGQYARHYVESEAAMAWVPARPKRLSGRGSGQPGTRPGAGRGLRRARGRVLRPT